MVKITDQSLLGVECIDDTWLKKLGLERRLDGEEHLERTQVWFPAPIRQLITAEMYAYILT